MGKKIIRVGLFMVALIFLIPVLYTFSNSFMTMSQLKSEGLQFIPKAFNLSQYFRLGVFKGKYFVFFLNSLKISVVAIGGHFVLALMAGYTLAKSKSKIVHGVFVLYVLLLLLPFQVTFVPNLLVMSKIDELFGIRMLDSHFAIILPGVFSAFGVFLLRQFIRELPDEMIEAARLDGASELRIIFRVILPNIKPAVLTLLFLLFIDYWNIIEQAIVFLESETLMPLSVFLENIYYDDFSVFYAGSMLYIFPAVVLFFKLDKHIYQGISIGGKGQ